MYSFIWNATFEVKPYATAILKCRKLRITNPGSKLVLEELKIELYVVDLVMSLSRLFINIFVSSRGH
jgi:hypothetical protein